MSAKVVYYPYIQVPDSPWLSRVLLYWDELGAIVPSDYIQTPEKLGRHMIGLVREGLVTQLVPGMFLWEVPRFTESFLEFIDARAGAAAVNSQWAVDAPPNSGTPIHAEKLQDLVEGLCSRGLARRAPHDKYSTWVEMESNTASDFMAYLAAVLGQLGDEQTSFAPITDLTTHSERFGGKRGDARRASLRAVLLRDVLPAPAEALEPAAIRDFKEANADELRRFRRTIEDEVSALAMIDDAQQRRERLSDVTRRLREESRELRSEMEETKAWPRLTLTSFLGLVAAGAPCLDSPEELLASPPRLFGAAAGLSAAVLAALGSRHAERRARPLAYAALAPGQAP